MRVEIEGPGSAVRLELQGIHKPSYERSKARYTRAFLLRCADLDICKQLPPGGLDPLLLRELQDAPRELLQLWRRASDPSTNINGKTGCSISQFIERDTCGRKCPTKSGASSDNHSRRLNGESSSQENNYSDTAQCKEEVLDQSVKETQKTASYQLRKSENPYRPPHLLRVGNNKFEDELLCERSSSLEMKHSTSREETRSRAHNTSSDKHHQISISDVPDTEHSGNTVDLCLTKFPSDSDNFVKLPQHVLTSLEAFVAHESKVVDFDSCKINLSMNSRESNEESSLSAVNETAKTEHLAANVESDTGCSANLHVCRIEGLSTALKYSSEKHSVNSEMRQDDDPISDMRLSDLCCRRALNSGQTGSDDWTTRTDFRKPDEFPFVDGFDFLTSSAGGDITTRTQRKRITAVDVTEQTELDDIEDNGLSFEDVWSDVLASMRFEQEMDLISVAGYGQRADSEIQVCLPDEDSFISTAYPSSCEPLEGNNCDNSADSDAEICLPDENNLISIDHMIVSDSLRLEDDKNSVKDDTLTTNPMDKVAKEQVTVGISRRKRRSAPQRSTVSQFHDSKASLAHQELHFQHTHLQTPWTGMTAVIPHLHPFDFQQAQMRLQMPLVVPTLTYPYSAVDWYSCTHMLHPWMECDFLVQYSLQQQPTTFP